MELVNGAYRARAVEGRLGETSTGNEQVVVQFELLDEGYEGRTIQWYGFFTEKTFDVTFRALRACGWHGDDLSDLVGLQSNEVVLIVENEVYNGKNRSRVRWVNPIQSGPKLGAPLPEDRARAFAARMKAKIRSLDAEEGRKPAAKPAAPAARQAPPKQAYIDDDIPF